MPGSVSRTRQDDFSRPWTGSRRTASRPSHGHICEPHGQIDTSVPAADRPSAFQLPAPPDRGPDADRPPGWQQYSRGEYAEAIERFRRTLEQNPEDANTLYYLARSFTFLSSYDSARAHIERAIAIDPGDPRLHETLGIVHTGLFTSRAYTGSQADHAAAAISSFERAVALDSSRMGAHYNLGVVYGYLDSTRLARLAFAAALRADSTYAPAHKKLGHLHLRAGELENAAASFRNGRSPTPRRTPRPTSTSGSPTATSATSRAPQRAWRRRPG